MTALVLLLLALVQSVSVACPIHDTLSTFTGKTKSQSGKMLYEYRCPRDGGHLFWVVQQP